MTSHDQRRPAGPAGRWRQPERLSAGPAGLHGHPCIRLFIGYIWTELRGHPGTFLAVRPLPSSDPQYALHAQTRVGACSVFRQCFDFDPRSMISSVGSGSWGVSLVSVASLQFARFTTWAA